MSRRRVLGWVAGGTAGLLLATAAGFALSPIGQRWRADAASAPPAVGVSTIELVDSSFVPAAVRVEPGHTLTWSWVDDQEHNVVFDDGPASAVQAQATWSRTFVEPGTYDYTCTLHAFMDGRVIVGAQ